MQTLVQHQAANEEAPGELMVLALIGSRNG